MSLRTSFTIASIAALLAAASFIALADAIAAPLPEPSYTVAAAGDAPTKPARKPVPKQATKPGRAEEQAPVAEPKAPSTIERDDEPAPRSAGEIRPASGRDAPGMIRARAYHRSARISLWRC